MSVAVVTDSTSCLPPELAAQHGIHVVPLHVLIDGASFVEGFDILPGDVASALREHRRVSTSKPSAGDFLDAYQQAADEGAEAVVSIHLSEQMSGTLSSARLAAAEAQLPVTVVDSRSLGMAMGYGAVTAAQRAAAGDRASSVAAAATRRTEAAEAIVLVDGLEHLRRGGRIGRASALLGSALAIKPLLHIEDGVVAPLERVRTRSKARARMVERVTRAAEAAPGGEPVDVAVHHLDQREQAQEVAEAIRSGSPRVAEVLIVELSAAVAAHTGPGTLATVVAPRPATTPPVIGAMSG